MIRVLVTGSRDWTNYTLFAEEIAKFISEVSPEYDTNDVVIVHGDATTGLDFMAEEWASVNYVKTEKHHPDYEQYGRAAPQVRNQVMVAHGADVCLAFIKPCRYDAERCKIQIAHGSHGASRTARLAEQVGIETRRFTEGL